jgi:hypothetical protein
MTPSKLQPALFGGLFIGVLSALPVVSIGNVCCCLWLVSGGVLAAWLLQQNHPYPVTPADGAATGLLAGLFGAVVYLVVSLPITLLMGPMMDEWLERAMESAGDVPWRDLLEQYRGGGARTFSLIFGFFLQLVLGMVFATLGGVLGAMLFRKRELPPPPPPPPTSLEGPWVPPTPPVLPPTVPPRDGGDAV